MGGGGDRLNRDGCLSLLLVEEAMKPTIPAIAVVLALFASPAWSQVKPCEELKAEIAAKLVAKGVTNYTLKIVAAEEVKDVKVVGSCDGGTKRITYTRGQEKPEPEGPEKSGPAPN